jgi:predicted transcriptional regulator
MITLELDIAHEQRLEDLARRRGRNVSQLVSHIIEIYLDAQSWVHDSAEQWAEASTALTPEIFAEEDWEVGENTDGSG